MPKNYRFYIVLLIAIAGGAGLIFIFTMNNNKKVCIADKCFRVEIADTNQKRAEGLMYRENLEQGGGMLFIFEKEGFYSFWMKDTLIPLDIVWINKNKEVVHIEKNISPCAKEPCPKYKPSQKAMYVLEINPNSNIKTGETVIFK